MRCIAANRSVLTVLDQNATLSDSNDYNKTATTTDIQCMDIIQFADGWYSYPDLNTFNSDLLLDTLTIRHIKSSKAISPWNVKADNPTIIPLTEIATRQLEALFNLSQLLFGLARAEQSNYTFRDLQLGQHPKRFHEAGFNKFPNNNRPIDFFAIFQLVVNDILKSGAIDVVFMMYKDPRIRCVKQKCLDLLSNVATIPEVARIILDRYCEFLIQLIQGIRDGHLIEEKVPSLSVLLRLCKVIVDKNLIELYQHLIDMQFIDIVIDLFDNNEYKYVDCVVYFIKFESLALQCLNIILQCAEHVDMWSEKAQIRLVNYCCTLLHKSVLDNEHKYHHKKRIELNHLIYAEQHSIIHSLSYAILTFLSVVRCRKEIGTFYRENEHFRELLSAMRHKYGPRSEFMSRDPSISNTLNQIASILFDRHQRKKKRHHYYNYQQKFEGYMKQNPYDQCQDEEEEEEEEEENRQYRRCSNSLCQMIENDQVKFQNCPHCHKLSYCSQYCREVHWTLNHNSSCRSINHNGKKDDSTILCMINRCSETLPTPYQENNTLSIFHKSIFETLPIQMSQPVIESTAEITNELCYPSSSSTTTKKKSFKTLLSLLRFGSKRR
ncbi:unnamed protein product [Rotaria sordida]|uniref:MYND-type domain-containing protein n=1 Tax=Rotaria sordida TaxID=392033 RepID=A0A814IFF1_9BILA|nr:unnamed protein product [Rotaria sordida]CAF3615345.1 unnamed protein product [Rotaria sordida]